VLGVGNFFFAGARVFLRSLEAAIFLFSRVARIPEGSLVMPAICTEGVITLGAELACPPLPPSLMPPSPSPLAPPSPHSLMPAWLPPLPPSIMPPSPLPALPLAPLTSKYHCLPPQLAGSFSSPYQCISTADGLYSPAVDSNRTLGSLAKFKQSSWGVA
jgi:hypothetical protein